MRVFRFGLAAAAIVVEAAIALVLVFDSDTVSDPWLTVGFAVTAGALFAISGLVAIWRRPENPTGLLLAAVGYTWFLGALVESPNDWIFTIGVVFEGTAFVAFAALTLAFPTGRLTTAAERAIVAGAAVVVIVAPTLRALVSTDPIADCESCAQSSIAAVDAPGVADAVEIVSTVLGVGLIVAIVVILTRRWRGASPALRRVLGPVLATSAAAFIVLAAINVLDAVVGSFDQAANAVFLAVFATVPVAFLYGVLRTRLAKSAATAMFASLEEGAPLREALGEALNDPALEIAYWLPERSIWVDADGSRVPAPEATAEQSVRIVERGSEKTAAVLYDPAVDTEPELLDSVVAAAALALHNEGLRASLRAQYLFLETITDTAPSLLIAIGLDGRILNQNDAAVRAAGYDDQEDVRGRLFWETFIDPDERDAVERRFIEAGPEHHPAEYENTFTNQRGERYVIDWRNAPLHDDHGAVVSIIAGGTDVTDRKARELELARERDATATVLQSIPSVVVVLGPAFEIRDRDVDNPLAAVNRAFRDALGWTDQDVVHRSFLELVASADRQRAKTTLEAAAGGRESEAVQSRWLTRDGEEIAFEWRATPIADVTGRADGLILVSGSDVTERLRHEEEIRASRARLVGASDEARRRLERNLHDGAQQRLVSLSVSLRLAEAKLHDDPDRAGQVLAAAREELSSALEELRELARGIHPAVLTDRGLAAAVEALVLRTPFPVTTDVIPDRLPTAVEAAAYYVISEALANASKHAGPCEATVRVAESNGTLTVTVADDGSGGADATGGSGLRGLSDRLAALEGTLTIVSPAGDGTRIEGEIPLGRPALGVREAAPQDTSRPH